LLHQWELIRNARESVNKEIEAVRSAGQLGSSLQAKVLLDMPDGEWMQALQSLGQDLKFVFITSEASLQTSTSAEAGEAVLKISVTPSTDPKCERCWHYDTSVGTHAEHAGLCQRCVSNLFGTGETRVMV
jgi:isoleucyl-tRNA synthetase